MCDRKSRFTKPWIKKLFDETNVAIGSVGKI